jgi:ABC-2 type transport system ATP-binding protein
MIEIKHLTKRFDEVTACNNLSVNLDQGIIGLVGENGAGKSTLLRLISNVIYQNEGEIIIDGYNNSNKESKKLVFFLQDEPFIKAYQKIKNVFDFYKYFYKLDEEKFYRLINTFSLPLDRRVSGFSKGMKRQLFIAIALSVDCKYILLDEAFDGLDPLVMNTIKEEILNLKEEGRCIIIASHNINALDQLADRVLILYKGSLTKDGSTEDLATEMIKYQIALKGEIDEKELIKEGINVISLKKVGSIYHIVINKNESFCSIIQNKYQPIILEEIPLDPEEIVMLNMMISRRGENHE